MSASCRHLCRGSSRGIQLWLRLCKKCFDAVIKYQAKKKAFVALEKDLLGRLSAKTMQSGEGRGVKRPRVSVMTKSQVYVHMHRLHIDARLIDE